jgi:hypothetical protein
MKLDKKQYSIKFDMDLFTYLERRAKNEKRSVSNLVHVLLYDVKNTERIKSKSQSKTK